VSPKKQGPQLPCEPSPPPPTYPSLTESEGAKLAEELRQQAANQKAMDAQARRAP